MDEGNPLILLNKKNGKKIICRSSNDVPLIAITHDAAGGDPCFRIDPEVEKALDSSYNVVKVGTEYSALETTMAMKRTSIPHEL